MTGRNGRFAKKLDEETLLFSSSLPVDARLIREDIRGSCAHLAMLAGQRIISSRDAARIRKILMAILEDARAGNIPALAIAGKNGRFAAEDIHMAVEAELIRRAGAAGGKLHTARSRNDQVALDERLYLRSAIRTISARIRKFQKTLLMLAGKNRTCIIHGYTHLQQAQPVFLAHHLLAYAEMLERDGGRFADCMKRVNLSPLGAGALAGVSHPVDRRDVARRLGFRGILANSMDAVSDRDVQAEFIAACAITMMHLSRLAEDCVLWTSREWGLAVIGDAFATGSSMMPQKKNPDIAELVRGKTGRVYGDLLALLTVLKGLPLAYNRDLQEDKEPLFDAADTVSASLSVFGRMMASMKFSKDQLRRNPGSDLVFATDLADYLVRKGMPFRSAHTIVGGIVRYCLQSGSGLRQLPIGYYRKRSGLFGKDLYRLLDPVTSVRSKKSSGSTSPVEVARALRRWKSILK